ncbi:putative oxidoreductase [Aspergillus heteromorphus CBS 117.55]|uniref:Putative oxidoreductase n=1 Tax=Aspergillus heteromorphus CBS 117.55 TaxID=1448321 RepID=A0A317WR39_9EURO|nr:putative oxidoreductase [Aspergillus heteromorphus CBS 117.55]PWY87378.1 putative oxidoreductase [Aspergillus heteromorphus CBS 117.55]
MHSNSNATGSSDLSGACCLTLLSLLGSSQVTFPGSQAYEFSRSSFFSQQEAQLQPRCVVAPTGVEDVSTILQSLTSIGTSLPEGERSVCDFAIRSGGHTPFAGAASIDGGITIDLQGLKAIEVSSDRATVSVGPGATWGEVYSFLDPLQLTVAGGRVAQVGVGGLTTGGGISFVSPRYGWTCDTVQNFEVVLANGSIIHANADEHPDLLGALRGGSNNFGIVTRADLTAIEQGPVWGGNVYYALDTIDQQLQATAQFSDPETYDDYASLIVSLSFSGAQGAAIVNSIVYTRAEENPPAFQPFTEIASLSSTLRLANMSSITTELGSYSPNGHRQLFLETTFASTQSMLNATYRHWNTSLAAIREVAGIVWSVSLEPLPPSIYARASPENALGLSGTSGTLVVALLSATWNDATDDAAVAQVAREMFAAVEDDAHRLEAYHPFVYLNYAAPWQDPIASYGPESVERLRRVAWDVDPRGVFTANVPGGFKIPGEQSSEPIS